MTKRERNAAMYVRMSTDHQKYSTQNQADAIEAYATKKDLSIVATYADEGKSGLSLRGRHALKRLLNDVETGAANFEIILVLDITRWGRLQDADQSAYYEYICKRSGVRVEYVAEQFENDGSIGSNLFKTVKREMAGEYSRELSKKVFSGQCRLIELGYRQGGAAGYGLRRMLVDELGTHKFILNAGQHKSLQTDRVILVPGPDDEINTVNWMYQKFANQSWAENRIAEELNRRGIKTDIGNLWTAGTVHQVLTNEKYIGNNVFNRTSNKLNIRTIKNEEGLWIRADGAFEAIVSQKIFYDTKKIICERNRKLSNEEMLEKLHKLHKNNGQLSGIIIDEQSDMPSSGSYQRRFGSLLRAYTLVGYTPERDYSYIEINQRLRKLHSNVLEQTVDKIRALGTRVEFDASSGLLNVNNELSVSILISRYMCTSAGSARWKLHFDTSLKPDVSLAIRMDAQNRNPLDYYILPFTELFSSASQIRLSEDNGLELDAFRHDSLDYFFQLTERVPIGDVA